MGIFIIKKSNILIFLIGFIDSKRTFVLDF